MNSYRRGLRSDTLVNLKLFLLEKVKLGRTWSNLVKLDQTCQTWSSVLKTRIIWYESLQSPYLGFIPSLSTLSMFESNEAVRDRLIGLKPWDRIDKIFGTPNGATVTTTTDLGCLNLEMLY